MNRQLIEKARKLIKPYRVADRRKIFASRMWIPKGSAAKKAETRKLLIGSK